MSNPDEKEVQAVKDSLGEFVKDDAVVEQIEKNPNPPLTVDSFYEKSVKLNEVYNHNARSLYDDFMKKQGELFNRLSEDDKKVVIARETDKARAAAQKIVTQDHGLVDSQGRKIGTA